MWSDIVRFRVEVYIKRVSTRENIADLPSRPHVTSESFMRKVGATEIAPNLPEIYKSPETWEVLHERLHAMDW